MNKIHTNHKLFKSTAKIQPVNQINQQAFYQITTKFISRQM